MYWPNYLILLASTLFACALVPVAYVVWIRLVGLEPTVAVRAAALSGPVRTALALVIGGLLGVALQFVPSLDAGMAFLAMVATAAFAGLLLFEVATHRDYV